MEEAPDAQPRYAGWGYRVGAYLTDLGLALAAASVVSLATGEGDEGSLGPLAAVVVWLLVTTGAMAYFKGQTVGKRIAGTRVVIGDRPVGFGFSLLRDQLLRVLYLIPLFFLIDSIWAAADSQRQTLRDKIVGSHVVHAGANAKRAVAVAVLAPVLLGAWVGLSIVRDSDESGGGTPPSVEAESAGASEDHSSEYGDLERTAFVESCKDEGESVKYCSCLFDYIAERVPYENSFASIESDDMSDWHPQLRNAMLDGIDACS